MKKNRPSAERSTRTTIRDIAAHLNLSVATISRALTHPEMVRPETRRRVQQAITEMQYFPNALAQGLARQETRMVFLIVPVLSAFFLDLMDGVEQAAQEEGYIVSLINARGDMKREQMIFDQVAARRADGVLLASGRLPPSLEPAEAQLPPTVALAEPIKDPRIPSVTIDHVHAAFQAVQHLIACGHRRIGHLASPDKILSGRGRRRGYQLALRDAGIPLDEQYYFEGPFDISTGERGMRHLLAADPPPTAVFADNDEIAFGALRCLRQAGLRVPEDISLIGLDNQHFTAVMEPGMTTINIPRYEIGYQGMKLLIRRIAGDDNLVSQQLATQLIERETTARPR